MVMREQRVLIVDDDSQIRRLLRIRLESAGYQVSEADHGQCALELMTVKKPHLVILDVNMPGINGYEVCLRIKEELSLNIPVIMLTSRIKVNDERFGNICHADAYIRKPESSEKLLPEIERLLKVTYPVGKSGEDDHE